MRTHKKIDTTAECVVGTEALVRLLCTPLYYNEKTHQVSPDTFDLRLLGKNQDQKEDFVSLFRRNKLDSEESFHSALQVGYSVWDNKSWETNSYYGYGTFFCQEALIINDMIEIWPLVQSKDYHIGMFYAKSDEEYYSGPLPKDNPVILEMLSDLADLIAESVEKAPKKYNFIYN